MINTNVLDWIRVAGCMTICLIIFFPYGMGGSRSVSRRQGEREVAGSGSGRQREREAPGAEESIKQWEWESVNQEPARVGDSESGGSSGRQEEQKASGSSGSGRWLGK